jgi:hypothetical protein
MFQGSGKCAGCGTHQQTRKHVRTPCTHRWRKLRSSRPIAGLLGFTFTSTTGARFMLKPASRSQCAIIWAIARVESSELKNIAQLIGRICFCITVSLIQSRYDSPSWSTAKSKTVTSKFLQFTGKRSDLSGIVKIIGEEYHTSEVSVKYIGNQCVFGGITSGRPTIIICPIFS